MDILIYTKAMQIFIVGTPLETAEALDPKRLRSQINECKVILRAINAQKEYSEGVISKRELIAVGFGFHPIVKSYVNHYEWLLYYLDTLTAYSRHKQYSKYQTADSVGSHYEDAREANSRAVALTPEFITEEFMNHHKRRLYTKNPTHYAQWAELGASHRNWFSVDGEIWVYENGKRI